MMTKILLIGDVHGKFEELDAVLEAEKPFDFFISVGDVGTTEDVTPENIKIIDKWQKEGYFVKGNHDNAEFFTRLVSYQVINGLAIAGLNGLLNKKTFRSVLNISHMINVDILVTHQAPYGMFEGKGELVLRDLLNYISPSIYVFGHVHAYKTKFHKNTFCISLPMIHKGYGVAYFEEKKLTNLEITLKKGKQIIRI